MKIKSVGQVLDECDTIWLLQIADGIVEVLLLMKRETNWGLRRRDWVLSGKEGPGLLAQYRF